MRKFLVHLALFGAAAAVGYAAIAALGLVSQTWEQEFVTLTHDFGGLNRRATEWNARTAAGLPTDVVFMGSSTCYSGIDPAALEAYGLDGFNLCSSGQRLEVTEALLGPALRTAVSPRLLVLDMYAITWKDKWPVQPSSSRDWIVNGGLGTGVLQEALVPVIVPTVDPFTAMLAAYFQVRPHFVPLGSRAQPDATGEYVARGFFKRTRDPLEAAPPAHPFHTPNDRHVATIARMAELCEQHGVQLVLVHPPLLGCEAPSLPPSLSMLPVIDGNQWPGADDFTNFYDNHHQVAAGAAEYSQWLAGQIAALAGRDS